MAKNNSKKSKATRLEKDTLGEKLVPSHVFYGIQTLRAKENFPISGVLPKREFIKATASIKKAAAMVNGRLKLLNKEKSRAIAKAATEVMSGTYDNDFIVDVYQAGAGTSHNMNTNEVIANVALKGLGKKPGNYKAVHPNDDVNMGQSTNDVIPTAIRLACLFKGPGLLEALGSLHIELLEKSREFKDVIKSGRTHLQDAMPITLGQELHSYGTAVKEAEKRIKRALDGLKILGIGGSAVGTGINTHKKYRADMVKELIIVTGISDLKPTQDYFYSMNSMDVFVELSGALRLLAVELTRIANDFRLLSSGPKTGLGEIFLEPIQPGSSIMPGKVNPVLPEMLNMVCYQVFGHDETVKSAASAGQLELNVMMPVINYNLLQSMEILTNGVNAFTKKCVTTLKVNEEQCRTYFDSTVGIAAVLNPIIGYGKAALVAKESEKTGKTIEEVVLEMGLLTKKDIKDLLDPKKITKPNIK